MSKFRKTRFRDLLKILVTDTGPDRRPPASRSWSASHSWYTRVCADEGVCLDTRVFTQMCLPPSGLAVHQKSVWVRTRVLKGFTIRRAFHSHLCLLALNPAG